MDLKKTISRNYKISRKHIALSTVLMFVNSTVVMSAEWTFEPSVMMNAKYNDNIQMTTVEKPASGMTLRPRIRLSRRTEVSDIMFSGETLTSRYDDSRFDSDEIMLDFGSSFKNTERSTVKLNAGISSRSTLTTEEEDSGRFDEVERSQDKITFGPSWEYQLSTSSVLQASYSGQDVDYNGSASLNDYQNQQVRGSYSFRQNEKSQYSISLVASRFEPDGTVSAPFKAKREWSVDNQVYDYKNQPTTINVTDTYGFQLGITRNFSQTLNGNVNIGLSRSESTLIRNATPLEIAAGDQFFAYMTPTAVSTGVINTVTESTLTTIATSLTKNYELTSITVTLDNSLKPSSNGILNETTSAGLNIKRKMSSKLTLTAGLKAISSQTQMSITSLSRDYYTASLGLNWDLTRWWKLGADYYYRQQQHDLASDSTESNKFIVALTYKWPKKSVSR